jgi:NAD-dependent dihydropyrimidine dehydrogenase PreA subunit
LGQLGALAADAARRIREIGNVSELAAPVVLGNTPPGPYYRPLEADGKPANFLKGKPKTDPDRCIRCGLCAKVCSMGSIDPEDVSSVPGICIKCQACVLKWPNGARYVDDPVMMSHKEMLEENYGSRHGENAWYL